MHPATLMSCPRIHRRNRRRQTRTAIRDDQRQVLAFQSAAIQILEQAFPVGLTLSLTAQKRQQVTPALAPHAVSHQHLYPLASRWTPHPHAHSIQEQVSIVIAQLGLSKLANRLVQLPRQCRDRLRAHRSDCSSKNRCQASFVCPYKSPQKLSFISARKCWKCSLIGIIFAIGCRSPFQERLSLVRQSQLTPSRLLHNQRYVTAQPVVSNF